MNATKLVTRQPQYKSYALVQRNYECYKTSNTTATVQIICVIAIVGVHDRQAASDTRFAHRGVCHSTVSGFGPGAAN
jgi:hypothetical protein